MQSITKKVVFLTLFIILLIYIIPLNKVFAATTYTQTLKSGIESFPEDYQKILEQIQKLDKCKNWTFEAYYTGIDWDTVVLNETSTHGRNRVIRTSEDSWKCSCGNVASGYACASEEIVKYYLDPRNFLNEVNIFQFLEISYNSKIYNSAGVKNAVKNSFLDSTITYKVDENGEEKEYTKHYADIILEAAEKSNMSPYSIASKIIQEVGRNGSDSVKGTYEGYEGYYNFFNLGAYDTGNAIVNALKYARDREWNNQYKAIIEGAKELSNSYTNAGQNTAYFYKWDVVGTEILKTGETKQVSSSDMFWHQYMTNIQDPTSQSSSLYNTYAKNGILEENLNFIIPIYNNMPGSSSRPSELTTDDGDLYFVNCTDGLAVREEPTTSSKSLTRLYKNTVVVVLERECKEADGYKWDKVKLSNGITGYIASKWLTFKVAATNKTYKFEDENIKIVPGTDLTKISKDAKGELKTGAKIEVNGKEYTAVVMGDTNGDGEVDVIDLALLKRHLMNKQELEDCYYKAGMLQNDGKEIDVVDLAILKRFLLGKSKINL